LGSHTRVRTFSKSEKPHLEKIEVRPNDRGCWRNHGAHFSQLNLRKVSESNFLKLALSKKVRKRAMRVSVLVGSILVLINHADSIYNGSLKPTNLLQILATYIVPYLVSTYSSVSALKDQEKPRDNKL